jgi:hypothetical protein
LARIRDAAGDLARARSALSDRLAAPVRTLSFPHGSYDASTVQAARAAGYEIVFTSDRILNALPSNGPAPTLLGRVGIFEEELVDGRGRFRPEQLALWLWRPPIERLDEGGRRVDPS